MDAKPLRIIFDKVDTFIRVFDETSVTSCYLEVVNMISFAT